MIMAEWTVLEWLAAGAVAGGTTLSAVNQAKQAKEAKKLHKERAAAALKDAEAARKSFNEQARSKRKEGKRYEARQRVLFAKEGVRGPTALDILKVTADEFEKEAGYISEHGVTEYKRGVTQAGFERDMGRSAYRAGMWGAASTVMSGVGTLGLIGAERGWFEKKPKLTDLQRRQYGAITSRY
jgi:hypothetical protein